MDRLLWWFGRGTIVIALSGGMLVGCSDDEDEPMESSPATTMNDSMDRSGPDTGPEDGQSGAAEQDDSGGGSDAPSDDSAAAGSPNSDPAGAASAPMDSAACMATVPAELDVTCATCACEMGPGAIAACDAGCWELIDCVSSNCADPDDVACIVEACPSALGPAAGMATAAGDVLTACACEGAAGPAGSDSGIEDSAGQVDPAACMASLPPELDAACATCVCETDAAAITACGLDCWTLIDCSVANNCGSDITCLSEFCSDTLTTGGTAAEPAGMVLTQCGCGSEDEGADAGVGGM